MTSPPPPPLDEQLVLELEFRVAVNEAVEVFPSGRRGGLALPANKNLTNTPRQASLHNAFRLWHDRAIVERRQHRRLNGRWTNMFLQQRDVEDIVDAGSRWQLETVSDTVDDGADAEWPVEARAQLASGSDLERRRRPVAKAQPHPVAHLEGHLAMVLVVV
jgi:hypothetical protein